jgi:hypothetical protein
MSVSGHRNLMRSFIRAPRSHLSETRYGQGRLMVSDFVLRTRALCDRDHVERWSAGARDVAREVRQGRSKKPGAIDVSYNVVAEIIVLWKHPVIRSRRVTAMADYAFGSNPLYVPACPTSWRRESSFSRLCDRVQPGPGR